MHNCEIKIRLTEQDDEFLRQLAQRNDIAPAALARSLLRRAMYQQQGQPIEQSMSGGRAAEGLWIRN